MTPVSNKDKFTPGQLVRLYPPRKGVITAMHRDPTHITFVSLKATTPMDPRKFVSKGTIVMFLRDAGGGDQAFVLFEEKVWLVKMRFMRPCKRSRVAYAR